MRNMRRKIAQENDGEILHYIMTFMGGFLGLYAICAHGNYGSAQTGNLMSMVIDFVGDDIYDFMVRGGSLIIFCAGIIVSWLLTRFCRLPMRELCLAVDAAALALSALLPDGLYPFYRLYPLFFATSFQWGTFDGVGQYKSASLFLTGNLKNCVLNWTKFAVDRQREALMGARIYSLTIVSYILGGYAGCEAVAHAGVLGAFYGYLPLAAAGLILIAEHAGDCQEEAQKETVRETGKTEI